jgi:hypothetical protein
MNRLYNDRRIIRIGYDKEGQELKFHQSRIEAENKKLDVFQSEYSVESKNKENFVYETVMSQKNKNPTTSLISNNMSQENLDGVKQHFRDRMTEKKRPTMLLSIQGRAPLYPTNHSRLRVSEINCRINSITLVNNYDDCDSNWYRSVYYQSYLSLPFSFGYDSIVSVLSAFRRLTSC